MSAWMIGDLVLVGLGLPISLWIAARGNAVDRLVGLELASVVGTLALLAFSQAVHQPSYLIVPTVSAVLAFAGILVFTRLLAPRP